MVAKAPRHYWMDLLNVIACFAVVMLHCTTTVFANSGDTEWHLDVLFQSICIFAVPVFFMISGANLLGYREKYDTKTFFVRLCHNIKLIFRAYKLLHIDIHLFLSKRSLL